ncbi:MAG TPA: flagellin biosynthesis protein FlgN [Lachnospiraceae bacterium]|nr:flagellin biosynthesis protein FlgN [Lachnospiraceae bacterium]
MASLMEELIDTLDKEDRLYADLIPIQEEKIRAIIANDLDSLSRLQGQEQVLVDQVGNLENKRLHVTEDIATVLGIKPEEMNLEKLVNKLNNQPKEKETLEKLHDRLKQTMGRLQELNLQNKKLLTEALEMVEFNMNVIRSTRMSSGSSNYSSDAAQVDYGDYGAGMFDAKQ